MSILLLALLLPLPILEETGGKVIAFLKEWWSMRSVMGCVGEDSSSALLLNSSITSTDFLDLDDLDNVGKSFYFAPENKNFLGAFHFIIRHSISDSSAANSSHWVSSFITYHFFLVSDQTIGIS